MIEPTVIFFLQGEDIVHFEIQGAKPNNPVLEVETFYTIGVPRLGKFLDFVGDFIANFVSETLAGVDFSTCNQSCASAYSETIKNRIKTKINLDKRLFEGLGQVIILYNIYFWG